MIISEENVTANCCVVISDLPSGGLGCDIEVTLENRDTGGPNGASMCIAYVHLKSVMSVVVFSLIQFKWKITHFHPHKL